MFQLQTKTGGSVSLSPRGAGGRDGVALVTPISQPSQSGVEAASEFDLGTIQRWGYAPVTPVDLRAHADALCYVRVSMIARGQGAILCSELVERFETEILQVQIAKPSLFKEESAAAMIVTSALTADIVEALELVPHQSLFMTAVRRMEHKVFRPQNEATVLVRAVVKKSYPSMPETAQKMMPKVVSRGAMRPQRDRTRVAV